MAEGDFPGVTEMKKELKVNLLYSPVRCSSEITVSCHFFLNSFRTGSGFMARPLNSL